MTPTTGYAPINGLNMYYEIHGSGRRLVLLHGGFMTIEGMGALVPAFAETRQVIGIEQQGHGHTAGIDRPLTYEQMADDTAALLRHIGIEYADILGYSMGGGIALQLAIRHPELVRKLVNISAHYSADALYPESRAAIQSITPELFVGSPFEADYQRVAPNPADFPALVVKMMELETQDYTWPIELIKAPMLIIIGDSDGISAERAGEMFRKVGGGVQGDLAGLPASQLAVLPGTHHLGLLGRTEWIVAMTVPFLDAPLPEAP